jgi:hypothetical protein
MSMADIHPQAFSAKGMKSDEMKADETPGGTRARSRGAVIGAFFGN